MKKISALLMSCMVIINLFGLSAAGADHPEEDGIMPASISLNSLSARIEPIGYKAYCTTNISIYSGDTASVRMSLQQDIPNVGWRTIEYWISPDYRNGAYTFSKTSTDTYAVHASYRVVAAATVTNASGSVVEIPVIYSSVLYT